MHYEALADEPAGTVAAAASSLQDASAQDTVWIATPVRLLAGLSTVHVGNIVALDAQTRAQLASDFNQAFHDSGHRLHALEPDTLILTSSKLRLAETMEPARCLGSNALATLAQGSGAGALLQLGSEIEMWLHTHPSTAGCVSTLWLWGGGGNYLMIANADRHRPRQETVFGSEPFVSGLARLGGQDMRPAPAQFDESLFADTDRTLVVLETWRMMSDASDTPESVLRALDERWIAPAQALANRGEIEQLVLLANDRQITYRGRDRLKRWRRVRRGLAALA